MSSQTIYNWRNQDLVDRGLRPGVITAASVEGAAMSMRRNATPLAGALLAVLLVAAACGGADDGVATPRRVRAPAPPVEPELPPPAAPSSPAESPRAVDDETPEPPAGPAESAVGEELDEAAVNALVERMLAAQAGVTSSLTEMYMTMARSFPGEPDVAVSDVPFGVATTVGDLVRVETDMAAMADAAGEGGGSGSADDPLQEVVIEDGTRLYLNLGAFEDLDLAVDSPWLAGLDIESRYDGGDLWGLVDLAQVDSAPGDSWVHLGIRPIFGTDPLGEDVGRLLALALADGALLEARSGERTQVMGVDTMPYSFVIDLVALSETPDFLGSVGGEEFLGGLPGPLPIRYTVHLDDEDVDRRTVVEMDMGALTSAAVAAAELDVISEEEKREYAEIEFHYHVAVRLDTHSINDPALTVTLPDPSQVIDLLAMPLFEF